jgi:hypothetical protein
MVAWDDALHGAVVLRYVGQTGCEALLSLMRDCSRWRNLFGVVMS